MRTSPSLVSWEAVDSRLLGVATLLATLGLVMVGSASMSMSADASGNPFQFLTKQGLHLVVGVFLGWLVLHVPTAMWEKAGPALLLLSLVLLALVPFIGHSANGSTRWLRLGPLSLQVSEFVKLFVLIYLAGFLVRRSGEMVSTAVFMKLIAVLGAIGLLLLMEPDFGAAVVILSSGLGLMFLGGVCFRRFMVLVTGLIGVLGVLAVIAPYRFDRLLAYLDPWSDRFGGGYQLTQALIAFGRGEWTGTGLGASVQKLYYLPEAHTDFLFAIIGEELGLVGSVGLILAFSYLVWRGFQIGLMAERKGAAFSAFAAYGISLWLGIQGFINLGVNVGVLPTKGLTLPLVSYGGSSVLVTCMALGLLLRIHLETTAGSTRRGAQRRSRSKRPSPSQRQRRQSGGKQ